MVFQTTNFINYQLPRHIKNCQTHNISRVHLGLHLQSDVVGPIKLVLFMKISMQKVEYNDCSSILLIWKHL